jgi:hypothetical protein
MFSEKNIKKLIIASFIIEEALYFFDWIDHNTTLIIISKPQSDSLENIFLEHCTKLQCVVVYTNEYYLKNDIISERTKQILDSFINNPDFGFIITHPKENNINLNKSVYDHISKKQKKNHYVYTIKNTRQTNNHKKNYLQTAFLESYANILSRKYVIPQKYFIFEKFTKIADTINEKGLKLVE